MKIPFDIKFRPQIESGEYKVVIEYDNRTFYARIVCWDFNSTELLACVNYGDREDVLEYDSSGKHIGKSVGRPDLIIITPEPELSEWETFISGCLQKHGLLDCGAADRIAKECSAELLDLAERQLLTNDQINHIWSDGYDTGYGEGKRAGREEALKDLPRWSPNDIYPELNDVVIGSIGTDNHFFIHRGRIIHLESLEKLPGFNE